MSVLTAGNCLTAVGGRQYQQLSDSVITVGHAVLLGAALTMMMRRGSNDFGGLIDAAVFLMCLGGLLWTSLLQPRMVQMHAALAAQIALLVSVFVLAGVLGGLGRLWVTAGVRLLALELLLSAVLLALVGNTSLAVTTGSMTFGRLPWVEMFFLVAYGCVGAAALHPTAAELTRPGPAPVDRLTFGRLAFLGAAVVLNPVVGGGRVVLGLPSDGLLMALGSLAVGPLVMLRIGRLAGERQRAEEALIHQATHDALTGLPNRGELLSRLETALALEAAAGKPAVVLLFCDLNGFKAVNDRLGHAVGDRLLVAVAGRLRTGLRAEETLARYGGDEFLLFCETDDQSRAAARLYGHVEHALAAPIVLSGEAVPVGISIGAVMSDGTTAADELIRRADEMMYQAKEQRRHLNRDRPLSRAATVASGDR
jgi:diguanylate cyclase (GGDEF)-like protein